MHWFTIPNGVIIPGGWINLSWLSCPVVLPGEELFRPAEWRGSEAKEIDLHSERNYTDIALDIYRSQRNQIYVGIKGDVPSQISFKQGDALDLFSFLPSALGSSGVGLFGSLRSALSQQGIQSQGVRGRAAGNIISWEKYSSRKMHGGIWCVWFTVKRQDIDQHCAHTHTHLRLTGRLFDCADSSPLLPPRPPFTDTWCILSLLTHVSLHSHTAASPVKRQDCCEWTGLSSAQRW